MFYYLLLISLDTGHRLKTIIYCFSVILLSSCSSVPLSSLVKLASFDNDQLVSINPNEIKVRLSIAEPGEAETKNVKLALKFNYKDGVNKEYLYQLVLINSSSINEIAGWFSKEPKKHQYVFRLPKISQVEFMRLQKELPLLGKPDSYHWTVYYYLKEHVDRSIPLEIDLEIKLADQQEYFYLLKSAPLVVNSSHQ